MKITLNTDKSEKRLKKKLVSKRKIFLAVPVYCKQKLTLHDIIFFSRATCINSLQFLISSQSTELLCYFSKELNKVFDLAQYVNTTVCCFLNSFCLRDVF